MHKNNCFFYYVTQWLPQDRKVQGSAKIIPFLAAQGRRLDRARADGNCLFRSLSKQLFNNADYHGELREMLIECAASNPTLFKGRTIQGLSLEKHLQRMAVPGAWGSHLEITAAATIFSKTIYVASDSLVPGECRWTAFSPLSSPNLKLNPTKVTVTNHHTWLEIAYSNGCHYDAINTDTPTPPVLTGKTSYVTEIL